MILTNTPQKIIWLLKSGTKNKVTLTQVGVVVDVVIRLEPLERCQKRDISLRKLHYFDSIEKNSRDSS